MKYTLLLASFLLIGFGFTQKHVAPFTGTYQLDIDETNQVMIEKGIASAGEKIPDDVRKQMESITLKINKGSISMNMMGNVRDMKFSDRESSRKDGQCDLVLILDKDKAVEGAKEKFLTIITTGEGKIQLKSEDGDQDMDNFIWSRIE